MSRNILRSIGIVAALMGAVLAVPAAAQMFSEGFEFLKAVKDRDGDAVTKALNEPGSTIVNTRDISSGATALHIVTQRRDLVWINFLTQLGAEDRMIVVLGTGVSVRVDLGGRRVIKKKKQD